MNIDDLLFKFKNKDYGAYYLRKKYTVTLLISLSITITLVILFIIIPLFIEIKNQESNEFVMKIEITPAELSLIEDLNEDEPELQKQKTQKEDPLPENKEDEVPPINTVDSAEIKKMQDSILLAKEKKDNLINTDPRLNSVAQFECGSDLSSFRNWFLTNFQHPVKKKKLSGKLNIQFSVNLNGIIDSVNIIQGLDPEYDLEIKKLLLNSPRWSPCYVSQRKVKMLFNLPIIVISQ
jgi:protein TonB